MAIRQLNELVKKIVNIKAKTHLQPTLIEKTRHLYNRPLVSRPRTIDKKLSSNRN